MKVACPVAAVRSGAPGGHAGERVGEASNPGPSSEEALDGAYGPSAEERNGYVDVLSNNINSIRPSGIFLKVFFWVPS